jgi:hypothetical protein
MIRDLQAIVTYTSVWICGYIFLGSQWTVAQVKQGGLHVE